MFEPNSDVVFDDSPLDFEVVKTPLAASMPDGSISQVKGKVGITRTDNGETLAIVGSNYGLVQNADLFKRIDDEVFETVGNDQRETAMVKDRTAKGGALCIRDYAFPKMKLGGGAMENIMRSRNDKVTDLGFRLLVANGFGGSSLSIMAGAIDFYCSNGMVLGKTHGVCQVRHTRKVEFRIVGLEQAARDAVGIFQDHADVFARYVKSPMSDALAKQTITDSEAFSDALGGKIFNQWLTEKINRGANAWALYSAATNYASHLDGDFAIRNTGNDHAAATMLARSKKVNAMVASDAFQSVLAH